jgi:hypothetical protein
LNALSGIVEISDSQASGSFTNGSFSKSSRAIAPF